MEHTRSATDIQRFVKQARQSHRVRSTPRTTSRAHHRTNCEWGTEEGQGAASARRTHQTVLFERPLRHRAVSVRVHTVAVLEVVVPLAAVPAAVGVVERAAALTQALVELALVPVAALRLGGYGHVRRSCTPQNAPPDRVKGPAAPAHGTGEKQRVPKCV